MGRLSLRFAALGYLTLILIGDLLLVVKRPHVPSFRESTLWVVFYVALASGAITFIAWFAAGEPDQELERTITVLVIDCPHALGLAIPLVDRRQVALRRLRHGALPVRGADEVRPTEG